MKVFTSFDFIQPASVEWNTSSDLASLGHLLRESRELHDRLSNLQFGGGHEHGCRIPPLSPSPEKVPNYVPAEVFQHGVRQMTLSVHIRHRQGRLPARCDVPAASSGRLTRWFGPSGSGKTSLINMIGGLVRPASGLHRSVGGQLLVEYARRASFVPKHGRRIELRVPGCAAFPASQRSVKNLGYGRFFTPAAERYADFTGVVDLLGDGHLLERKPASLSGGEKQRVAIGRALIASPKLILMDEPLASSTTPARAEILPYIERLRDETKIPIARMSAIRWRKVARLASDVVVLSAGKVTASGPADDILTRLDLLPEEERGEAGAMIDLTVAGQEEVFGLTVLHSAGGEWRLPRIDAPAGAKIRARVRART